MEGLTRLVSESLARHGFDRPLDYRRLCWSRWFRCESHHSLLFVPSKPGVFAIAEEIMDFGPKDDYVATAAKPAPSVVEGAAPRSVASGAAWPHVSPTGPEAENRKPEASSPRRMLAVTQFFEDEDMAFVLDRMLSRQNPMSARLASGRYFARFVVIEDQTQRRSICNALNQWMVSAVEKATGIGSHFATSLELTSATEYVLPANDAQATLFDDAAGASVFASITSFAGVHSYANGTVSTNTPAFPDGPANREGHDFSFEPALSKQSAPKGAEKAAQSDPALAAEGIADIATKQAAKSTLAPAAPQLDSGAATNIHCPSPFPSGF